MDYTLFTKYRIAVQNFRGDPMAADLLLAKEGPVSVYYAPFDWVNPSAKLLLVGITPGKTQATHALAEARRQLVFGASDLEVLRCARATAAFSGPMRPNLTQMLDKVGLHRWLGIGTCDDLFSKSADLLQTASVLQYPVFIEGANYNGTPDLLASPLLRGMVADHFGRLARSLPNAVVVPLGPVASKAVEWLAAKGAIEATRVLTGLPHPSPANAERVSYFLGRKDARALSAKTNPTKLDQARAALVAAVARL